MELETKQKKSRLKRLCTLKLLYHFSITASFAEHPKFEKKVTFAEAFWVNISESVKDRKTKSRFKRLHILKMLYTGCYTKEVILLLLSRRTYNFKNKGLFYINFYNNPKF